MRTFRNWVVGVGALMQTWDVSSPSFQAQAFYTYIDSSQPFSSVGPSVISRVGFAQKVLHEERTTWEAANGVIHNCSGYVR